jgi:CobQ/CobB/MinD/ParA nucleotide binding domain
MSSLEGLLNWQSTEISLKELLVRSEQLADLGALVAGEPIILVRNWYGRLCLLLPCTKSELDRSPCATLIDDLRRAAGALAIEDWVMCRDELFAADDYWSDPALIEFLHLEQQGIKLRMLERQNKELDWLKLPVHSALAKRSKRCVFFSVKGGVGRSTALAMSAIYLAGLGRKVLVVDGDFESPGLSSSILPKGDGQPDWGVVDWLTAQALGASQAELDRMARQRCVEVSALTGRLGLSGQVMVAPAYGRATELYVAKLARLYRQDPQGADYGQRLERLLSVFESQHDVDITLFDCRAGIDDTAAAAITQIGADLSLLFAINTRQTWDSYGLMLTHMRRNLNLFGRHAMAGSAENFDIRPCLRVVSALSPQVAAAPKYAEDFRSNAYETFAQIYDEDDPDAEEPVDQFEPFSPDEDAKGAPHDALAIGTTDDLRYFDPLDKPAQLTDPLNQAAFVAFYPCLDALLEPRES